MPVEQLKNAQFGGFLFWLLRILCRMMVRTPESLVSRRNRLYFTDDSPYGKQASFGEMGHYANTIFYGENVPTYTVEPDGSDGQGRERLTRGTRLARRGHRLVRGLGSRAALVVAVVCYSLCRKLQVA